MSNSVRPHRWQPTRLPCPWDSPGKNTGVGCHFLLQCMKVKSESEVPQSCPTLSDPMDCSPPGSSIHGIFQAKILVWVANPVFFPSPYIHVHCYMTVQFNSLKRQSLYPSFFIWGSDIGFCQWDVNRHDITTDFKKSCIIELASITRSKMIDK